VDQFSEHEGPAVLVSQVQAGGVGLNIQAASVVMLSAGVRLRGNAIKSASSTGVSLDATGGLQA
jgi:hypothetical protein